MSQRCEYANLKQVCKPTLDTQKINVLQFCWNFWRHDCSSYCTVIKQTKQKMWRRRKNHYLSCHRCQNITLNIRNSIYSFNHKTKDSAVMSTIKYIFYFFFLVCVKELNTSKVLCMCIELIGCTDFKKSRNLKNFTTSTRTLFIQDFS